MKSFLMCLLLAVMLSYSASGQETYAVTFSKKDLSGALVEVAKQCDYALTMGNIKHRGTYSKTYRQKTIQQILTDLLSPTSYGYTLKGKRIIIHKRKQKAKRSTLSGYIYDKETGETLIGANIYAPSIDRGTSTNVYGFFSLTIPQGEEEIVVSYVGYTPEMVQLQVYADTLLDIRMSPSVELESVVITADQIDNIENQAKMSSINLPVEDLDKLPVVGGEVDIIKSLQLMPGVQSGNEGFAGLYVRGGSPDQNLIMLDGVPIYNASHLFGVFSVFNADAIKSTELIKGGYPARYGGRLSSILDIRMKDGNMHDWGGKGSIGLISSKITLEGPIIEDKMSVMVSGRRTYLDLIARPFLAADRSSNNIKGTPGFHFYDLNGKVNYKFSPKDRLYFSFYNGSDHFSDTKTKENEQVSTSITYRTKEYAFINWGNTILAARWNHVFGNKLFSNVTLTSTKYNFGVGADSWYEKEENGVKSSEQSIYEYRSKVSDKTLKIDFDYLPTPSHTIRFGAEVIDHHFVPGVTAIKEQSTGINRDTLRGGEPIDAIKGMLYVEDEIKLGDRATINIGANASAFDVDSVTYKNIEPRILANVKVAPAWSVKASYTQMTQYLHLLTNSGVGLPTDLWLSPTGNIPPQKSWQVAAGFAHTRSDGIEISVEAYYKKMRDLISYKEGTSLLQFDDSWERKVTSGEGQSYGLEFFVKKNFGKTKGWIGYTLSKSERQFEGINFGKTYPFKFDRRHDISIVAQHKLSDRLTIGANWVYGTGQAVTLPIREYVYDQQRGTLLDYGAKNSFRYAPYHRLDLSVSYFKKAKWGEHSFHLDIYNAYSRSNTFYIEPRGEYDRAIGRNTTKLKKITLLPIVPSIRWDFKF